MIQFDIKKILGITWYGIKHNILDLKGKCHSGTDFFTSQGAVTLLTKVCIGPDGKSHVSTGQVTSNLQIPTRLTVTFANQGFLKTTQSVVYDVLGTDYTTYLVLGYGKNSGWFRIMSSKPEMTYCTFKRIKRMLKTQNYNTTLMITEREESDQTEDDIIKQCETNGQ